MSAHQEFDPDTQAGQNAGRPDDQPDRHASQAKPESPLADEVLDGAGAVQARLDEVQAQADALQEEVLRARADAENARRRAQEEVAKARKFGIESFAESLVPVKDSLEAALAQPEQSAEAWRSGVETTLRQLVNAFERNHLIEIAPAAGDKFDPHRHQAISSVPAEQPSNTVVMVLQKGYLIADRVLRPALVTVAA